MRSFSAVVFTTKAILGDGVRRVGGYLAKAWLYQASIAPKESTRRAADRPGGNRGELVLPIRLMKRLMGNRGTAQPVQARE